MSEAPADVVVVGSGAGGAAAALALAQGGAAVRLLEAGPRYDPAADYPLLRDDWELGRFPHKVPTEGRQSFAPLQPLDPAEEELSSWNAQNGRHVGGPTRAVWGYHRTISALALRTGGHILERAQRGEL